MVIKMTVYYSKVDWWIAAILSGSILFCLALGLYLLGNDPLGGVICLGIGVFMTLVIVLLGIPCKYTLYDDHLVVQAGIAKYTILYADIADVTKSRNPLSAPAFSLKRVKIQLKKKYVLISPKNRDAFIADLNSRRN